MREETHTWKSENRDKYHQNICVIDSVLQQLIIKVEELILIYLWDTF